MRCESASECTGLLLSTIIARKRLGWSVRISSGMTLNGMRPVRMRCPPTGLVRPRPHWLRRAGALVDERVVDEILLHEHAEQRAQAAGVRAGAYLQVEVGQLRGLGAARIDDDQRACGIARERAQHRAGAREAVRLPRV